MYTLAVVDFDNEVEFIGEYNNVYNMGDIFNALSALKKVNYVAIVRVVDCQVFKNSLYSC